MELCYADFSDKIGFNYKNKEKPLYALSNIYFAVRYAGNRVLTQRIEKGFESDGTTLPRFIWWLLGCKHTPEYQPGSIIHDWIVQHPEFVHYNRKFCNLILRQSLLMEGVPAWKAELMFYACEFWQWYENRKTKRWRDV